MIHPSVFSDEKVMQLSRDARLLYIGSWTEADDAGRLQWNATQLRARIFPGDSLDDKQLDKLMNEIAKVGLVEVYSVSGFSYAFHPKFTEHQAIRRPTPSKLPPPPGAPVGLPMEEVFPEGSENPSGSSIDILAWRIIDAAWAVISKQHKMPIDRDRWRRVNKRAAESLAHNHVTPEMVVERLLFAYNDPVKSEFYEFITQLPELIKHWTKLAPKKAPRRQVHYTTAAEMKGKK